MSVEECLKQLSKNFERYKTEYDAMKKDTETNATPEGFTSHNGSLSLPEGVWPYSGIRAMRRDGQFIDRTAIHINWNHGKSPNDIVAYKVITTKESTALVEERRRQEAVARKEAEVKAMIALTTDQQMKKKAGTPSVCAEADKVIKDRHEAYGNPKQNFDDIAALWDVAFGHKMTEMFTASDVAQAMRLVKEARLINDPTHRDSLVDICGYAECQNEVNNGELVDELV